MTYAEFMDLRSGVRVLIDQKSDEVDSVAAVSRSFDEGISSSVSLTDTINGVISSIAGSFLESIRQLPAPPDDLSVEFGIRLHYRTGAIVSMDTEGAHFKVALRWVRAREAELAP
jgi:hypothetical protein